jgi:hypothetical protein
MRIFFACLLAGLLFVPSAFSAGLAVDATVGALFPLETEGFGSHIDFEAHLWRPVDQMVFVGLGFGIQQFNGERIYPLMGSLMARLPIGGTLMPFAHGEIGHALSRNSWLWKAGLGADLRLGSSSSILALVGYQSFLDRVALPMRSDIYARAGLLLEF